jgi:hypothetical protein
MIQIFDYIVILEMSSLSNYNTFNISPGKQAYSCNINDFWDSRLKFLARNNYLPLNERLFKINLRESSKCNICDDDIVEDLYHFLFECKTLRGIRQELFEEIETVIKSKIARSFVILHNSFLLNWSSEKPSSVLKLRQKSLIKNCSFWKGGSSENARSG